MPDSPHIEPPEGSGFTPAPNPALAGQTLAGQTVLITRAAGQAESLRKALENLGAKSVLHPVIQIGPPKDPSVVDDVVSRIADFDRIVFVSSNGVRFFLERIVELTGSTDLINEHKLAAIGAATSERLASQGSLQVDIAPTKSDSRGLGQILAEKAVGEKLLIVRADRGSQELANALQAAGIEFEELVAYQNFDVEIADPKITRKLESGSIDWTTVTSSAIARSTVRLFGDSLKSTKLVSISPTTTAALAELGFTPAAEAEQYNMNGIVAAILNTVG